MGVVILTNCPYRGRFTPWTLRRLSYTICELKQRMHKYWTLTCIRLQLPISINLNLFSRPQLELKSRPWIKVCSLCIHAPGCFFPLCVDVLSFPGLCRSRTGRTNIYENCCKLIYRFIWFMEFWKGGRLVWCLQWWLECTMAMHPRCWERSLAVSSYQVLCCLWSKWTSLCNWLTNHIQPNPTKSSRISQQLMRTVDLK
jgi:hypothetical protein